MSAGVCLISDLQVLHVLRWPVDECWSNELLYLLRRDPIEPADYPLHGGVQTIPFYRILR